MIVPDFSFERVDAADYARLRPDYAPEALAWVIEQAGLNSESLVLDLGAGPGSLARRFVDVGVPVVGVEPASNMRARLADVVGPDRALDGTAEAIPLSESVVDCVAAGQSAHWFRPAEATREIHRVLKPSGAFVWFWTIYGEGHAPDTLVEVVERYEPEGWLDRFTGRPWQEGFGATDQFTDPDVRSFRSPHNIRAADIPAWVATWSDVAALPSHLREPLLNGVGALAASLPELVTFDAATEVHLARRLEV